jgi:hypothetical protein
VQKHRSLAFLKKILSVFNERILNQSLFTKPIISENQKNPEKIMLLMMLLITK